MARVSEGQKGFGEQKEDQSRSRVHWRHDPGLHPVTERPERNSDKAASTRGSSLVAVRVPVSDVQAVSCLTTCLISLFPSWKDRKVLGEWEHPT